MVRTAWWMAAAVRTTPAMARESVDGGCGAGPSGHVSRAGGQGVQAEVVGQCERGAVGLDFGDAAVSKAARPAELYRLVAELAVLAGGLPQLLGQLDRWLHIDHDAGRVGSDDHADAGRAVRGAAADLAGAGATAHDLARVLNNLLERCDGRKLETGPW